MLILLSFALGLLQTPADRPTTAEEMLAGCRVVATAPVRDDRIAIPNNVGAHECWGAFGVLQRMVMMVVPSRPADARLFGACVGSESTESELVAVFVSFVDKHPERRHDEFVQVALDAFRASYPCSAAR
jgi:hypothetical protein